MHTDAVLAVNGISVSFTAGDGSSPRSTRTVVHDVGFELHRGRVLALVGESGSGKSVTAMSVLRLLPGNAVVDGSIELEGEDLVRASDEQLRRVRGGRIGTIFQEPMNAFNPVIAIGHQIAEALRTHRITSDRSSTNERVLELLRSVGLRDPERIVRAYPHELSGGQLQRAMIAMAISCDPVALIADEPTTALDVTVQAGILDLLRDLKERNGMAILLITHDMGVVADLADDVVVMREGVVVERADATELFANPREEYTRTLLASVPRLGDQRPDALIADAEAPSSAADAPVSAAAELRDVSIVYGNRSWGRRSAPAVADVSLRVRRGTFFGLVGESGSGKSTIGRALAGLVPVSHGAVTVDDVDLATASGAELRRARTRIGYVFQDPASSLNPRFTIAQCIEEPLRLHTRLTRAERTARVADLLAAVQLDPAMADRFPHELSGGQRQRVAIARALALRPSLLIADEPTSALDVSVQARVLELLRELQEEFGFACLFISHDLAVVEQLADDVAVLHNGRIVEAGPAARVLLAPQEAYTKRLLAAAPVADPVAQAARRETWRMLDAEAAAATTSTGAAGATDGREVA
ncbi:dipeptide ABC transporter ATP-binding protein [Leifsonia poae]|uniref:Oligopeptide ABC transporter, ATP-binding protein n=1 Tax=Leifsonia poae TaxID=110933 RepID=A0A9W6HCE9_9MICO|nr:ABC transporter ATP-binding protein [Leifsonia poae]GLJ77606.1 putative oligopeptide ABC transporter, ATP-binding protein [Leifsonia poae]